MTDAVVIKYYTPVTEASIGSLMHPVSMNFALGASYEEPKLVELVKSLRVDMENCASVVAANTKKNKQQVFRAMQSRTTLDPDAALE
ncbi:MAG TPA: hypothetical protein VF277_08485 [Steroidobacteraceae bacterium]